MTDDRDIMYMQRCIQLAMNGRQNVSPNPMVGAVIVHNDSIIGEGYHIRCGEAHAEVNAIRSVKDPSKLKEATIYVSLEPCSHHGKTPPCADLIIASGISRIVVGCKDPFVKVSGNGIRKLEEAGREVVVGVLEAECRKLISNFITYNTLRRPYVILKWAESSDGFLDIMRTGGQPARLSTDLTLMLGHKKRALADAIMVGPQTALLDNPSLTVRNWYGKNPIRIVLDKHLTLPVRLHLFDGSVPTLVYTVNEKANTVNTEYITLKKQTDLLPQIMDDLYRRGIQNLLVEGGSKLLQSFLDDGLWDEIYVEKSRKALVSGVKSPEITDKNHYDIDKNFGEYLWHYYKPTAELTYNFI